ncbi:high affinity glucose transporter [Umbelopsis nana]
MGNGYVYSVVAFSAIGGLLFGYDQGVISGLLTMKYFGDYFGDQPDNPTSPFSANLQASIVDALVAGCFFGALGASWTGDYFGRKYTILGGAVTFMVGSIIQATAVNLGMLLAGRVIAGLAVGMLSMICPLYQSEIAPKEIRGRLISMQQWAVTWGIMISFWINYGTNYINSNNSWQVPLGLQAVFAGILAIGMVFMPFSPRWLTEKALKKNDEAGLQRALDTLRKIRTDRSEDDIQEEFAAIRETIRLEKDMSYSWGELFKGSLGRRMLLGCIIMFFQQFTGINAIMYYAPQMYQQAGLSAATSSLLATGLDGIINMLSTIPPIFWMDTWGRRKTMISGALIMAFSLFIVGGILGGTATITTSSTGTKSLDMVGKQSASYAAIAFIFIFVAGFAYSWGPIGWLYPAEIFPIRMRAKAVGISTATNWAMGVVIGEITPNMLDSITYGTYLFFGAWCFIMAITVYLFFPETKGVLLEDMDQIFESKSWFAFGKHAVVVKEKHLIENVDANEKKVEA